MCRDALKKTFTNHGGIDLLKAIIHDEDPGGNEGSNSNLPWCVCGRCRHMPLEAENICCRQRVCITTEEFFQSAVLDMSVLSIAIVNRSDVIADDPDYTASSYRKAVDTMAARVSWEGQQESDTILCGLGSTWQIPST